MTKLYSSARKAGMEILQNISGAPMPVGPYSVAVKSNGLLFCAGQIGISAGTGKIVSGGVEGETAQVLKNIKAVLEGGGSSVEKIVLTTIFLTDITHGKVVNELYSAFVKNPPPARQTVAVKDLPMGALVEISVIAEL